MTDTTRAAGNGRIRSLYMALLLFGLLFAGRLFYLQVIRGEEYFAQALAEQQKQYTIPANRGRIYLREGDQRVPVVLNQTLKTLYADPRYVDDVDETARQVASVIGGNINEYEELLADDERFYVVLARKVTEKQAEELDKKELSGIGFQDEPHRTYPEGSLAAQVLGFVNSDGEGQYGIEQALNEQLAGTPGLLRAVTDVRGIPLTTSDNSVLNEPVNGSDVVLTIDRAIQRHAEQALERGVKAAKGKSGSVIVMDPHTGAVLAMANYPSFNPAKFSEVEDASRFMNDVVATPYEVGSVIKPFTMSTALNEGAIEVNDTYYDPGYIQVDDRRIENAGVSGGTTRTMTEVIQKSVNTGVVYALQELSGGDEVTEKGRDVLYDYFFSRFGFGQLTGVELATEAGGTIYGPDSAEGNDVRYANMTFGQGMSLTMLQVAAAYSSLVNGGTYYKPYLVHATVDSESGEETLNSPTVLRGDVISDETSDAIRTMMEQVVEQGGGYAARAPGYIIGGKTGTSQKLEADGTYSDVLETGSFLGFGASEHSEYVIMTKVDEPGVPGYAGTVAAAPIFADISNWLIDYYRVAPPR
jgi:cell division protein FtsI/penicillin-binding protein 2